MKQKKPDELIIFTGKNGQVKLRGDFRNDTMWVTQAQMSEVFGVNLRTVNEHLQNIYKTAELTTDATLRKFRIVQTEGKREVEREVNHYHLDAVISVGYRVNSKTATQFRQWATQTLRQHITQGFTINRAQLAHNYDAFMEAVAATRALLPAASEMAPGAVLELVQLFADTWFSLDAYDKDQLTPKKVSKKRVKLTSVELHAGIAVLKTELMKKGEASENFAQERNQESVEGIVGNVMQEFGGKAVYPTVEEKAAHLLYFIIKNHPFIDGNKRSGAYAFVWFLQKARVLDTNQLTPSALTALTLLIAQSDPKDKEQMTTLVVLLITQRSK
jgi:prophage maintenance system killer protein